MRVLRCLLFAAAAGLLASVPGPEPLCAPAFVAWMPVVPVETVSSLERPPDAAARLMAACEYERAWDAVEGSPDSLRAGVCAAYAGRHERAVELLARRQRNPYLEWLRLYHRARTLRKENRFVEAAATIDSFFAVNGSPAAAGEGEFHRDARELALETAGRDDSLFAARGFASSASSLAPREFLVAAEVLFDRDLDSLGAVFFLSGARALRYRDAPDLFPELLAKIPPFFPVLSAGDLAVLAERSLSAGRDKEAETIIGLLLQKSADDPDALALQSRLIAVRGRSKDALEIAERIAASDAPQHLRREALGRAASLEYGRGNLERAAVRYRTLGVEYGDVAAFELAGRIDIALGNYAAAIDFWKANGTARRAADGTEALPGTAVNQAALLHWLSRDREAYGLLREARVSGNRREAAACYWLSVTSPSASERLQWTSRLVERFPASLYTSALEQSFDSIAAALNGDECRRRLGRLVEAERAFLDSLVEALPAAERMTRHAAFDAYLYCIDRGMMPEAVELLRAIERSGVAKEGDVVELYRRARIRGFCDFAVQIVNRPFASALPAAVRARLQHPVAFAGVLAREDLTCGLPPELVLAVVRSESMYAGRALSPSGAVGLMQLLPSTARWMTRKYGWSVGHCTDLYEPSCNIRMGSRYLSYLLRRFDGSLVAALAAYNGGEGRMSRWRQQFDPSRHPMASMEMIGPAETRNYVKNVLDAMCFYRMLAESGGRER